MEAQPRKLPDDLDEANTNYESEADEYDKTYQKMHAAPVVAIAVVDLEIRSFARSLAPLAKDAAFVNRMVLSYAVPVALLVGTVVRSSRWEFSSP